MSPRSQPVAEITPDGAGAEERFQDHVAQLNLRGAQIAAALAAFLVPLFSVLDWFVLHPVFWELFWLRFSNAVWVIAVVFLARTGWGRRNYYPLSASVFFSVAFTIAAMVHVHD